MNSTFAGSGEQNKSQDSFLCVELFFSTLRMFLQ